MLTAVRSGHSVKDGREMHVQAHNHGFERACFRRETETIGSSGFSKELTFAAPLR